MWLVGPTTNDMTSKRLLLLDIHPGQQSSNPGGFCSSGGQFPVFFSASTPLAGEELWVSNGSVAGTSMLLDILPGVRPSSPRYLTWFKGALYFRADDGVHGHELWRSEGTAASTRLLLDIFKGLPDGKSQWSLHM